MNRTKMILISPYSRVLRNAALNPKNYPYWDDVIRGIQSSYDVRQLAYGMEVTLSTLSYTIRYETIKEAERAIQKCDYFLSVDNWVHHYAHLIDKQGIVIWTRSDPNLFGYTEQINLLKDRKYLRTKQFEWWENDTYEKDAFIDPNVVISAINTYFS